MKYRRRSAIVAPGIGPTPPVTTRVGMPSVCESTAVIAREDRTYATPSEASARPMSARTCSRWTSDSGPRGGRHGPP